MTALDAPLSPEEEAYMARIAALSQGESSRDRMRRWRAENPEKVARARERKRAYDAAHREERNVARKRNHAAERAKREAGS